MCEITLFQQGSFRLHGGLNSDFKIDCDALSTQDLKTLASLIVRRMHFCKVIGIPHGGTRLAQELVIYTKDVSSQVLIVDDVLTTGGSMELARKNTIKQHDLQNIIGAVIFARSECPYWVYPIFRMI